MDKETIFTFVLKINTDNVKSNPDQQQDHNLEGLGEAMNQTLLAAAEEALGGQFTTQRIESTFDVIEMAQGTPALSTEGQIEELRTSSITSVQHQDSAGFGEEAISIFRDTGRNIVLKCQIDGDRLALAENNQHNHELLNLIQAADHAVNNLNAQLDN